MDARVYGAVIRTRLYVIAVVRLWGWVAYVCSCTCAYSYVACILAGDVWV